MKTPAANEQIVARIMASTGLTHREAQVSVLATTSAIIEQLLEGKEVRLTHLGTFLFRLARARKIPKRVCSNGRVLPELNLPPRPKLKFATAQSMLNDLKGIVPVAIRKATKWSDKRNKKETL